MIFALALAMSLDYHTCASLVKEFIHLNYSSDSPMPSMSERSMA